MKQLLTRLLKEEQGQDVIEYGLLAAGISVIAVPTIPTVGTWVSTKWTKINTALGTP
jgi:pilus assembly protein Flp/PilA